MPKQILGLELLRGLCAMMVAIYHCASWGTVADFPSWGLYGVYIFFVISGAVLYHNYHATLSLQPAAGKLSVSLFLLKRFARLAPLYGFVALAAALATRHSVDLREVLNLSLLFGFVSPGLTSTVTGGWSLGIEFVFYALFPILLAFTRSTGVMVATLLVLFVLRVVFVEIALDDQPLRIAWNSYTQPGTFLVFFFAGMALARLMANTELRSKAPLLGVICLLFVFCIPGPGPEAVLTGGRGILYALLSIVAVGGFFWSPQAVIPAAVCRFFGEISYGLYLLHPLVWAAAGKLHVGPSLRMVLAIGGATVMAWVILRVYERPARKWLIAVAGASSVPAPLRRQPAD